MAEEEKKQQKPKVTLIKHRKQERPLKEQEKPKSLEKKRVVVVKKKIVVKRAPVVIQKAEGKTTPKESGNKTVYKKPVAERGTPTSKNHIKENKPMVRRSEPRQAAKPESQKRETENARPAKPRRFTPRYGGERRPKSFAPASGFQRERQQRSGVKPKTGVSASAEANAGKKQPNKKFFKTKKKEDYSRKKYEEQKEKIIQFKKKQIEKISPVPKEISIMDVITVSDLARKMNLKASELISKLMGMGMMVTINQQIDSETAAILADEYNCKVNIVSLYDETQIKTEEDKEGDLKLRPPIVTVMGHVDHGKTKLLDAIRTTHVADNEYGGITQHIGAYVVNYGKGKIVFLDTPGHEAFTLMRARGAQVTDIVILVVAADDGVMPQTVEAVNHAKEAGVPIIVAINKIDLPDANPEKVKKQLSDYDLIPEEWGGKTLYVEVSALKKIGIDTLIENILLESEILELRANYSCNAEGKVLESKVDFGRGIVSTVIIERGTLRVGDFFVAGIFPGKVRAMFNDRGGKIKEATPSMPVEILGFTGIPAAGDPFQVTSTEKEARLVGGKRQELKKIEEAGNVKKVTLDNLYDQIKEGEVQELKVIIKGDVHGSVEALQTALEKLSTDEVKLSVIHASAGAINEGDIMLASASNALVIGFHVRPTASAQALAEKEKIEIKKYNIIYEAVDDIKAAMEGMLAPELHEEVIGSAEVRNTFKIPKIGTIAGCYVTTGKIKRGVHAHIIREGIEVFNGKIASLKRFKDDTKEVEAGYECGIGIEAFHDIKVGDVIEAFEVHEIAKKLVESKGNVRS